MSDETDPKPEDYLKCPGCSKDLKRTVMVEKAYCTRVEKWLFSSTAGWRCPKGHLIPDEAPNAG